MLHAGKHEAFTQCSFIVGPTQLNIKTTFGFRVCWDASHDCDQHWLDGVPMSEMSYQRWSKFKTFSGPLAESTDAH